MSDIYAENHQNDPDGKPQTTTDPIMEWPEEDQMAKSMKLQKQFQDAFGDTKTDWLSEYRKHLDAKAIHAETEDGWPSLEAFSQFNVRKFIQERKATGYVPKD